MKNKIIGFYALEINYPLYRIYKRLWRFKKRIRGKKIKITNLPKATWKKIAPDTRPEIFESKKIDGNVKLFELAIISTFAGDVKPNTTIFEIGTFDGRTTLNLAANSPDSCEIITLDLPPDTETKNKLADGEKIWVDKPVSGLRFIEHNDENITSKIKQIYGDSGNFDFSPYKNKCSLVFVDGSHSYDNVISDSKNAFEMIIPGGVVLWHDYGVWDDVTKALEEIAETYKLEMHHIEDTSLVYWKKNNE
ncbi:MAG: class I SAM-dependent methyltransferase [Melioribacteraceae bacterium]|nr:class I SAM-dependent methyltransferase [Melioribacteraceae bacterium]